MENKNNIISKSVISYVNEILKIGIFENASDIHIKYDNVEGMEIKYRKLKFIQKYKQKFVGKEYCGNNFQNKNIVTDECCGKEKAARWQFFNFTKRQEI